MSPQRHRTHQLEEESRQHFAGLIGSLWVFRRQESDYGIDGEVEIFDSPGGSSTGLKFLVQLKATDDEEDPWTIRLDNDAIAYLQSQQLPVLLVRYQSSVKKSFVRWFHSFDLSQRKEGAKSFGFKFSPEDELHKELVGALKEDVLDYRAAVSPALKTPLRFSLDLTSLELKAVSRAALSAKIHEMLAGLPNVLATSGGRPSVSVHITRSELVVSVARIPACTVHYEAASEEVIADDLPKSIFVAIGLALGLLGHPGIAIAFFTPEVLRSRLTENPLVGFRIAHCFSRAGQIIKALELNRALWESQRSGIALPLFSLPLGQLGGLSPAERAAYEDFLKYVLSKSSGEPRAAATANYTIGNFYRAVGRNRDAIRHYHEACSLDPRYSERGYFLVEVAAACFDLRRYRMAVRYYEAGLAKLNDVEIKPLLADAQFFSGNIQRAAEIWEAYLASAPNPKSDWKLKAQMARALVNRGFAKQDRKGIDARKIQVGLPDLSPEERTVRIDNALTLDVLCGTAWFNRGVQRRSPEDEFASFLFAALCNPSDLEAWTNACLLSLTRAVAPETVLAIMADALFYHGGAFSSACVKLLEKNGIKADHFLEMLAAVKDVSKDSSQPAKLRIVEDDRITEISIDWPSGKLKFSAGNP